MLLFEVYKDPSNFLPFLTLLICLSYLTVSGFTSLCLRTFQTSSWQWFMRQIQYISNKPGLDKLNPIWWGIKLMWNAFTKAVANLILSTHSPQLLTWHSWSCVTLPFPSFLHIFLQLFSNQEPLSSFLRNLLFCSLRLHFLPAALQRLSKSFKRGSRGKRHNLYSAVN